MARLAAAAAGGDGAAAGRGRRPADAVRAAVRAGVVRDADGPGNLLPRGATGAAEGRPRRGRVRLLQRVAAQLRPRRQDVPAGVALRHAARRLFALVDAPAPPKAVQPAGVVPVGRRRRGDGRLQRDVGGGHRRRAARLRHQRLAALGRGRPRDERPGPAAGAGRRPADVGVPAAGAVAGGGIRRLGTVVGDVRPPARVLARRAGGRPYGPAFRTRRPRLAGRRGLPARPAAQPRPARLARLAAVPAGTARDRRGPFGLLRRRRAQRRVAAGLAGAAGVQPVAAADARGDAAA